MRFIHKILDFIDRLNDYHDGLKGTALPSDSPIYVGREIDSQVYLLLKSNDPNITTCYVFGTPQSGKSSLALRLIGILEKEDKSCIFFPVKTKVRPLNGNSFFSSLAHDILHRIKLENEELELTIKANWLEQDSQPWMSKFEELLKIILQTFTTEYKVYIFIDDIQELESNVIQDFMKIIKKLNDSFQNNLFFVIFGGLHPKNFENIADPKTQTIFRVFHIKSFVGECRSLAFGMTSLMQEILIWTGGQPLMTLAIAHLTRRKFAKKEQWDNLQSLFEDFIKHKVIDNWENHSLLALHKQSISNYFIRGSPEKKRIEFYALEEYKSILLQASRQISHIEESLTQRILIESGLVTKVGDAIMIANPIYRQIFNRQWTNSIQQSIHLRGEQMKPSYSICDRDFFFLVDASASMRLPVSNRKNKKRFDSIQESVQGHIDEILSYQDSDTGKKICDDVTLAFFNIDRKSNRIYGVLDLTTVQEKFLDTKPAGDTYIAPTFSHLLSQWLRDRQQGRGAGVVIYLDGLVDDRPEFIQAVRKIASELDHHSDLKILIVGIGDAINSYKTVKWYLELDLNGHDFRDSSNNPCNIAIFNRMDDVNELGGVIPAIEKQLIEEPKAGLDDWINEEFPDLYAELKEKYNIP
ncbi:AAA family ATPase [Spirulina sp. 06S082]|nr:AAA family ATPase [Spirulina sp. 06S082]